MPYKNDDVIHKICPICNSTKLIFENSSVYRVFQVCQGCNCVVGFKRFDRKDFELEALFSEIKKALCDCTKLMDAALEIRMKAWKDEVDLGWVFSCSLGVDSLAMVAACNKPIFITANLNLNNSMWTDPLKKPLFKASNTPPAPLGFSWNRW